MSWLPQDKLTAEEKEKFKSQPNAKRVKRFITDLLSLGIQGFSAFYQNRKQKKLKKEWRNCLKGKTDWIIECQNLTMI